MKKSFRVKRNEDFGKIIEKRQSIACKEFVIYYLPNDQKHARTGISVSKKLGNAVMRNRIKRQVREICQHTIDQQSRYDYVVIVRKSFLDHEFQENLKSFATLYERLTKKQNKGVS